MTIVEMVSEKNIKLNLNGKTIPEVFYSLAEIIDNAAINQNIDEVISTLIERESLGSTGVGYEVGLPHMRFEYLDKTYVSFGLSRNGIDFNAIDGKPVRFFFLVVASDKNELQEEYLHTMANITRLMRKQEVREEIGACKSPAEVIETFTKYEAM